MTEAFMPDVLSFIISYLQLKEFLDANGLGATSQSALDTVNANLEWYKNYGDEISAWLTRFATGAASYLSISPTISIIIILSGYLITNY
jgi:hypothetical protein